jgi:hypothetical protein
MLAIGEHPLHGQHHHRTEGDVNVAQHGMAHAAVQRLAIQNCIFQPVHRLGQYADLPFQVRIRARRWLIVIAPSVHVKHGRSPFYGSDSQAFPSLSPSSRCTSLLVTLIQCA